MLRRGDATAAVSRRIVCFFRSISDYCVSVSPRSCRRFPHLRDDDDDQVLDTKLDDFVEFGKRLEGVRTCSMYSTSLSAMSLRHICMYVGMSPLSSRLGCAAV